MEHPTQVATMKIKKKSRFVRIIWKVLKFVIVVGIIGGLGFLAYYNYREVRNVKDKLYQVQLNSESIRLIENRLSTPALVTNDTTPSEPVIAPVMPSYSDPDPITFTVTNAFEDKNEALEPGYSLIVVDLKMENKSKTIDKYFNASELELKDPENYEYSLYNYSLYGKDVIKKDAKILLPGNRIVTDGSTLKPGETQQISVAFMINRSSKKFTLSHYSAGKLKDINF